MSNPKETIKKLQEFGLSLDKSYGQNFLVDKNILNKIITTSKITKKDKVIEIGAGIGTLSLPLVQKASFVNIVELDKSLLGALESNLSKYKNYKIINIDALKLNPDDLNSKPNKMVSNLPYNIAAPLMIKLLTEFSSIDDFFIMVQKEMADRFCATKNAKNYSSISVKMQLVSNINKLFAISANSFLPKPKVSSSFIHIKRKKYYFSDIYLLFNIIEASFHYRRKKIVNSLALSPSFDDILIQKALKKANISTDKRAQELEKEDFINLSNCYANLK